MPSPKGDVISDHRHNDPVSRFIELMRSCRIERAGGAESGPPGRSFILTEMANTSGRRTVSPLVSGESRKLCVLGAERTGLPGVLDKPTPPLLPTVGTGNRFAAGQPPVPAPVGQRPLPRLPSQLTGRARLPRPARDGPTTRSPGADPRSAGAGRAGGGCRRSWCASWPAALRRTWRVSSSNEAVKANDGHAAIDRPIRLGSATATLAAKLATLPATNNAHGSTP